MLQYASPEVEMHVGNNVFLNGAWYRCHKVIKNGRELHLRKVTGEALQTLLRRLGATNRAAQEEHDGDRSDVQMQEVQSQDGAAGRPGEGSARMSVQSKDPYGVGR